MFGDAVLVSHAIVRQWDEVRPITLSPAGIGRLRARLPDTLLKAGIDMLCIGNNLIDQEQEMADIADTIERALQDQTLDGSAIRKSIDRVRRRKALLNARNAA